MLDSLVVSSVKIVNTAVVGTTGDELKCQWPGTLCNFKSGSVGEGNCNKSSVGRSGTHNIADERNEVLNVYQ